MARFGDLTQHTYTTGDVEDGVHNVGWLGGGSEFPVGETSEEFRKALAILCDDPIMSHRGFHKCEFCQSGSRETGNGQIRVRDHEGRWYAAPTMVGHYVSAHGYRPPEEFVNAVMDPAEIGR